MREIVTANPPPAQPLSARLEGAEYFEAQYRVRTGDLRDVSLSADRKSVV